MYLSSNPLSTSIHELQILVRLVHAAIVSKTVEEERVQALLQDAMQDMKIPLLERSIIQGLARTQALASA